MSVIYKRGVNLKKINEKVLSNISEFIKVFQLENGRSPRYREIQRHLNLSSLSLVERYVNILEEKGELKKDKLGSIDITYNINLSQSIIAPVVGEVRCGEPIFAQENIESVYRLPTEIFGSGNIFLLHAKGDSMEGVGIREGDLLVVKKCESAENGDVVVALLEDSATVKTFYRKHDHVVLHPENDRYDDIITKDVKILGIVKQFIHSL